MGTACGLASHARCGRERTIRSKWIVTPNVATCKAFFVGVKWGLNDFGLHMELLDAVFLHSLLFTTLVIQCLL
jgi:hypothetical protein